MALGLVGPAALLPMSILDWAFITAAGEPAPLVTPLAWAVSLAILGILAGRTMERMEL